MLIAGSCYPPLHAVSRLVCHRRATQVAAAMDKLSAVGRLFAEAVFLVGELRRQRLAEVSRLEHRPDFDLARAGYRIGAALHPFDRLGHVLNLPEPETSDQLAGLGKRAIND